MGRKRGAGCPPLFEKRGHSPPLFWTVMTTSCHQQCLCILQFTGQMAISNCLPLHFFSACYPLIERTRKLASLATRVYCVFCSYSYMYTVYSASTKVIDAHARDPTGMATILRTISLFQFSTLTHNAECLHIVCKR